VFDLAAFSDVETGKAMIIWYIDVGVDVWIVLDILVGHSGYPPGSSRHLPGSSSGCTDSLSVTDASGPESGDLPELPGFDGSGVSHEIGSIS